MFELSFLEEWRDRRKTAIEESQIAERYVADLLVEQKNIVDTIRTTTSQGIRKALEEQYDALEVDIKAARKDRTDKEQTESEVKEALRYARYLMEHLKDILIDESNPDRQRTLFGSVFKEFPTYDELVNGTPKLAPIFALNLQSDLSESDMVTPSGFEPELTG